MTLNEYMNKNFTVIDATSQGMSLQEAIEEVKMQSQLCFKEYSTTDIVHIANGCDDDDVYLRAAIATILNAVAKGELK